MSITRKDFIYYLINEAKRKLIKIDSEFLAQLYTFIDSKEGGEGFKKFQQIDPNKLGLNK